jgi:glycosyltransferase involved in cell wall biosynthesis
MTEGNDQILISIIMPAYNCETYIEESVRSILNQTHSHFELLILDDHSTDGTIKRIEAIADSRIRLIKSVEKLGQANLMNKGIQMAKAEFIAVAHADDINMPERFQKQVEYLHAHPEVGVVGTFMDVLNTNGTSELMELPTRPAEVTGDLLFYCSLAHPSVMLRKSVLIKNSFLYRQEYVPCEDYDLWTRMAANTAMANIPYVGVQYRMHANQISKTKASLTQRNDGQIREALFRNIFSFSGDHEAEWFLQLFDIKATTKIHAGLIRYFNGVRRKLKQSGIITYKLWQQWIEHRLQMAVLSSSNYNFGAGLFYVITNPKSINQLGLKKLAAILYRSLIKFSK